MVLIPPESFVVDETADNSSNKYTLCEVSVTCADDGVIDMFADMTVSSFITFPEIVGNAESVAMLDGAMAKSKYVNIEQFSSVRKLTLKFLKSKYDRAAITIDTPFVATANAPTVGVQQNPRRS